MKKTLFLVFVFFIFSCGVTEYYYLNPPVVNTPATGLETESQNYYNFFLPSVAGDTMLGTVVYYKIYNSDSAAKSAQSSIESSNIQYSSQGMNRLINLGYRQMYFRDFFSGNIADKLPDLPNQSVIIRIITRAVAAQVEINGFPSYEPLRFNQQNFEILKSDGNYTDTFTVNDSDVAYSSGTQTQIWYVNAYAAAFGQTPQFEPVYSQLAKLGVIRITTP